MKATAEELSRRKSIKIPGFSFANAWTARVAASSSRQLMWRDCLVGDHGPLVLTPLHVAPQPNREASDVIVIDSV